ncbi:MAG: YciI family protein [Bryobacteraceae bacterium]
MKYLLAIYLDEAVDARKSPQELQAEMGNYYAFTNAIKDAGVYIGGEALHPIATATTVRVNDGKIGTTDGPFAETKEQLGGFYMLDCANLDEAIQWAAKIPHASQGSIEIRPVMDFSQVATA